MRKRGLSALVVVAIAAIAAIPAGASGGARTSSRGHTVVLKNIRFNPSALRIHRGDSVTWAWRDGSIAHNVTGTSFKSRTQSHGSFTVRFMRRGTFNYRCTIHARLGMRGTIIVR